MSARSIVSLVAWRDGVVARVPLLSERVGRRRLLVSEICGAGGLTATLLHGVDVAIYDTICAVAGILNDRNARLVEPALEPFVRYARAFPDVAHVWVHRTVKHLRYAPPYETRDVGGTARFRTMPDAIYLGCPDRWHGDSWLAYPIPRDGSPSHEWFRVGQVCESS